MMESAHRRSRPPEGYERGSDYLRISPQHHFLSLRYGIFPFTRSLRGK